VLNEYEGESVAARTNPETLRSMTGRPVWTLPPLSVDPPRSVVDSVMMSLDPQVFPSPRTDE